MSISRSGTIGTRKPHGRNFVVWIIQSCPPNDESYLKQDLVSQHRTAVRILPCLNRRHS